MQDLVKYEKSMETLQKKQRKEEGRKKIAKACCGISGVSWTGSLVFVVFKMCQKKQERDTAQNQRDFDAAQDGMCLWGFCLLGLFGLFVLVMVVMLIVNHFAP